MSQEADKTARAAIQRLLSVRDYLQQDVVKLARARSQRAAAADDASSDQAQADLEVCHTFSMLPSFLAATFQVNLCGLPRPFAGRRQSLHSEAGLLKHHEGQSDAFPFFSGSQYLQPRKVGGGVTSQDPCAQVWRPTFNRTASSLARSSIAGWGDNSMSGRGYQGAASSNCAREQ